MKYLKIVLCCAFSSLVGCAAQQPLDGHWEYRSPAGQAAQLEISSLEKNRIYVSGTNVLLSGVYERSGDTLKLVKPDNPRAEGFKLRIVDTRKLIVIEEPATAVTGQKHVSGVLSRTDAL